jgi:hypothetical protein
MKTYQAPAIETTRDAVVATKSGIAMGPEILTRAHPAGSVGFAL